MKMANHAECAGLRSENRSSELIVAVERGDEVSITRRGVIVPRLVAVSGGGAASDDERERVAAAFTRLRRLRQIRDEVTLEGDLRAIAREGLD